MTFPPVRIVRVAAVAAMGFAIAGSTSRGAAAQERPNLIIGGEQDRGYQVIGPRGIIVTRTRIVVIESKTPLVRVLTKQGELVQTFGRSGSGPGEFSVATSFAHDTTTGEILVFDVSARRVTYLALGDSVRYVRTRLTAEAPYAGCLYNGVPWVITGGEKLLVELRLVEQQRFVPGRAIGDVRWLSPDASEPIARRYAIAPGGILACDSRSQLAIVMSPLFGEAHFLRLDGLPQRHERLLDFLPMKVTAQPLSISYEFPPNGIYDQLVGALVTQTGIEAVVARHVVASRDSGPSYRRILMAADGTQRVVATSKWRPMLIAGDGAYCYMDDPAPTIARFASGRCP